MSGHSSVPWHDSAKESGMGAKLKALRAHWLHKAPAPSGVLLMQYRACLRVLAGTIAPPLTSAAWLLTKLGPWGWCGRSSEAGAAPPLSSPVLKFAFPALHFGRSEAGLASRGGSCICALSVLSSLLMSGSVPGTGRGISLSSRCSWSMWESG